MDRSPSVLFQPYLGAVVLVLLGALFVAVGTRMRGYDFDAHQSPCTLVR